MKLQRTTLGLLVTAIVLGGVVYFSEIQRAQNQEATKTTKEPIFSFKEDQVQSVTIYTDKETLEFERVSGQTTNWRMKLPTDSPASDATVAFLLNLLAEGKSDRSFLVPTNQRQEYALDQPFATVKVQLKNKQTHRLILGKSDFNNSFIYAQADPPPQTPDQLKVLLVPIDFEYAVNRPLSEWQSKLEKSQSPTPSPTAEGSPSPNSKSPKPSPNSKSPKPSPTSKKTPPSPTSKSPKPSPTSDKSKPSPASESPKPSPSPEKTKPSPTPKSSQPSPTPKSSQPSPASESPKPSPTPKSSKPSPVSESPKPSPTPKSSKPSPGSESPKPSPTPKSSQPSPASESPKPSPTPKSSQPSPASESPKPSPS
jgi:hypothetical protein